MFQALPAKGDTIVVHGSRDAEVVRVRHTEHYPARPNPRPHLGDETEHRVQIFVDCIGDVGDDI
jgi:hypothetical protein